MKNQIAPRLSAVWDVNGDGSLKVYGSLGRYYLQMPTQVAARAASRRPTEPGLHLHRYRSATGAPTGLRGDQPAQSPNGEYGQRKDPRTVVVRRT